MFHQIFGHSKASLAREYKRLEEQPPVEQAEAQEQPAVGPSIQSGPSEDQFSRQAEAELEEMINEPPVVLNKKDILARRTELFAEMGKLEGAVNGRRWNESAAIRYEEAHQEFKYWGVVKDKNPQECEQYQLEKPFSVDYDKLERDIERKRPKSAKQQSLALKQRVQDAQARMQAHRAARAERRLQPAPAPVVRPVPQPVEANSVDDDLVRRLEALRRS